MMMVVVVVVIMRTRMTDSWYGGGGINCCDDDTSSCYYDRYDCDDYYKDESMYHKSHLPKVEGTKGKDDYTHTHTTVLLTN